MEMVVDYVKNVDWSIAAGILGGLFSLFGLLNAFTAYKNRSRGRLKTDLEILKYFEKEDANYILIKNIVDKNVKSIYSDKRVVHKWGELIFGILYSMGFIIWASSVYLKSGTSFGFYVLISYVINGVIIIIDSFIEQGIYKKSKANKL